MPVELPFLVPCRVCRGLHRNLCQIGSVRVCLLPRASVRGLAYLFISGVMAVLGSVLAKVGAENRCWLREAQP